MGTNLASLVWLAWWNRTTWVFCRLEFTFRFRYQASSRPNSNYTTFPITFRKEGGTVRNEVGARLAGFGNHDYCCLFASLRKAARAETTVGNDGEEDNGRRWQATMSHLDEKIVRR